MAAVVAFVHSGPWVISLHRRSPVEVYLGGIYIFELLWQVEIKVTVSVGKVI